MLLLGTKKAATVIYPRSLEPHKDYLRLAFFHHNVLSSRCQVSLGYSYGFAGVYY
jgi:hypothetical protein